MFKKKKTVSGVSINIEYLPQFSANLTAETESKMQ